MGTVFDTGLRVDSFDWGVGKWRLMTLYDMLTCNLLLVFSALCTIEHCLYALQCAYHTWTPIISYYDL